MKAVSIVLVILFFVTMFNLLLNPDSASGFGFGSMRFGATDYGDVLYDESGHAVCYKNGTAIGEDGWLLTGKGIDGIFTINAGVIVGDLNCEYMWSNTSNPFYENNWGLTPPYDVAGTFYGLYEDPNAGLYNPAQNFMFNFFLNSQLGFLSIVGIVMTVIMVVGFKVFSSGESEASVVTFVKFGVYLGLFMALSAFSYAPIISIFPPLGLIFYFALTGVYMMGCMGAIQGSGAD